MKKIQKVTFFQVDFSFTNVAGKSLLLLVLLLFTCKTALGQKPVFSRQDTLRGSITPERSWWDLKHYALFVDVNPQDSTISGENTVNYKVLSGMQVMQIDLQSPMKIIKITQDDVELEFKKEGNAHFVRLRKNQVAGDLNSIRIFFEGKPRVSENPPWSGGFTWKSDGNGNKFITTTCQGIGASLWWPCKDHMYDEADSMDIHISIPAKLGLTAVSNGRLKGIAENDKGKKIFSWSVSNPINNYGVNINIGDYVHFSEKYQGEKGTLDCDYYVLKDHLPQAQGQFKQVPMMLKAFEHWFGPYPFYEDGYKLVEVPYLGMEHQSCVTYGNGFKNGYLQQDLSRSGWGFNFDFIIVHESGHEWFANSITNRDVADMWIHESFTSYAENLFLDYYYGTQASAEYVIGTRRKIENKRPVIGIYDVNHEGPIDMYYKGANMLHTLRQLIGNDEKWREILREMNQVFYHQTVTTQQIENFLSEHTGINLSLFFDQYLRDTRIPELEYYFSGKKLKYRWSNCVKGFDMPVKVTVNGNAYTLKPSVAFQELELAVPVNSFSADINYYVTTRNTKK